MLDNKLVPGKPSNNGDVPKGKPPLETTINYKTDETQIAACRDFNNGMGMELAVGAVFYNNAYLEMGYSLDFGYVAQTPVSRGRQQAWYVSFGYNFRQK